MIRCLFVASVVMGVPCSAYGHNLDTECGVRCLFVALHSLDESLPLAYEDLKVRLSPGANGNSLAELQDAAEALGMKTLGVRTTLEALRSRTAPAICIAHLKAGHYVLLLEIGGETVRMVDPPQSASTIPASIFQTQWSGNALLLSKSPIESEELIQSRLWWRKFGIRAAYLLTGALIFLCAMWTIRRLRSGTAVTIALLSAVLMNGCQNESNENVPHSSVKDIVSPTIKQESSDSETAGKLTVAPNMVDLGTIEVSNRTATAEFTVTNNGNEAFEIKEIHTSCGCTVASTEKSRLQPGESTRMVAAVNLTELGTQTSRVRLTGSVSGASAEAYIRWTAGSVIRVEPAGVFCGEILCGTSKEMKLTISPPDGQMLDDCIDRITVFPEGILNLEADRTQQSWQLLIHVAPTNPDAHGRGDIKIHGKNGYSDFRVPVEWRSVETISLNPPGTLLGSIAAGESWTAKAIISSLDMPISEILLAEGSPLRIESERISENRARITLNGVVPQVPGPFKIETKIEIKRTNDIVIRTLTVTGLAKPKKSP